MRICGYVGSEYSKERIASIYYAVKTDMLIEKDLMEFRSNYVEKLRTQYDPNNIKTFLEILGIGVLLNQLVRTGVKTGAIYTDNKSTLESINTKQYESNSALGRLIKVVRDRLDLHPKIPLHHIRARNNLAYPEKKIPFNQEHLMGDEDRQETLRQLLLRADFYSEIPMEPTAQLNVDEFGNQIDAKKSKSRKSWIRSFKSHEAREAYFEMMAERLGSVKTDRKLRWKNVDEDGLRVRLWWQKNQNL